MVLGKTLHLELPRRVVVYYLLFCLATVVCLLAGAVVTTRLLMYARSEQAALSQLERVSSKLEIAYLRDGEAGLQQTMRQVNGHGKLAYCAVVDLDGNHLAQSSSVPQDIPDSGTEHWRRGEIECIEYTDEQGRSLQEYRRPLSAGDEPFAILHLGVATPNAIAVVLSSAEVLPLAILGPLTLLVMGAFVLQRIVRPLSEIDAQLRTIAVISDVNQMPLEKVRVRGPGSLGWNRLVAQLESGAPASNFDERIGEALAARTAGKNNIVLNSLPDGIATTNEQGTITFANHAFLAFLGRSPEEGIPADCAVEDCLDLRSLAPDSPFLTLHQSTRNVVTEIKRSGESGDRFLRLARHPMRSENGHRGHIWTIRDITQQKLADRMRDEFLDSATHELRTPLTNIRAYAETLALSDMLEVEQQKEFCNTINSEATRLARLIDDLLSVSSMEAGSLSINRENTDVARLMNDVADKVRGQMDQKDIKFETVFSEKLPELPLDKDKISASLVNLLGNAAKYTPEGGRVAFKVRVEESKLICDVEDNGIGISEEELSKVFGKFFRSSDDRVREITGTGLGLSLAHEIIRLHGGTLTVRSELNVGSTFTISLPVKCE